MKEQQAMIFWMSGVFTPSYYDVLFNTFSEIECSTEKLSTLVGLHGLHDQLSLGQISDKDYCNDLYNRSHFLIEPAAFIEGIHKYSEPTIQIFELLNLLPKYFQFWLVVDYPKNWFDKISKNLDFHNYFPEERRIILSNYGLKAISPDLFEFLPSYINLPNDRCLLIDSNSKRVINAINYGLPSIIYIDAQRLMREFKLRKLIAES